MKATDLKFGVKALEELDKCFSKQNMDGLEIGVGIQMSIANYTVGDLANSLVLWLTVGSDMSKEEAMDFLDTLNMEELNTFGAEVFDVFTKAQAVMFRMEKMGMTEVIQEARVAVLEASN